MIKKKNFPRTIIERLHAAGWTPGVGDGQGGLACCDSRGRKESDATERLNWTDSIKHKKECTKKQCLTQYYKKILYRLYCKDKRKKNLFLGTCDSQLEFFKTRLQFVKQQQQRKGTHRNIMTTTFSKLCSAPVAYILTVQNTFPKTSLGPHEKLCE